MTINTGVLEDSKLDLNDSNVKVSREKNKENSNVIIEENLSQRKVENYFIRKEKKISQTVKETCDEDSKLKTQYIEDERKLLDRENCRKKHNSAKKIRGFKKPKEKSGKKPNLEESELQKMFLRMNEKKMKKENSKN